MISLDNVTVVFGRTLALDQVSVEIPEGVTGVFGPNGSGKSTLLKAVAGLLKPQHGRIAIDGSDRRDETARRAVGYAGHGSGLYGRLSLRENLELFASLYGASAERAGTLIDQLGLREFASRPVAELSAGSKRRAAVARALVHDPDVLLLDEPYANVDDEASEAISRAVATWKTDGKTALVATHGAKKVKAYADGGIILQRGRLIRSGRYTSEGFTAT
ncbi:MAG: heme ABC exporter ATP-binding protein CcmA [Actinobacteria bacterium]|nr:heme ABC exporter ATP-binding protein CcmA [Actinomycetota bacterium]